MAGLSELRISRLNRFGLIRTFDIKLDMAVNLSLTSDYFVYRIKL